MSARAPLPSATLSITVAALTMAGVCRSEGVEPTPATAPVAAAWQDTAAASWRFPAPAIPGPAAPGPLARARGIQAGVTLDGARGGGTSAAGRADGWLRLPLSPRLAADLGAGVLTRARSTGFDRGATRTQARLTVGDTPANAWLGVAFERNLSGEQPPRRPLLALGVASQKSEVAFSASLEQSVAQWVRLDSVVHYLPDSTTKTFSQTRFSTATHAVVSARWEHRRLSVETMTGVTLDRLAPPQWWSQSSAAVAVLPRLAIFATVGSPAPRWLSRSAGLERGAALGVHLRTDAGPTANAANLAKPPSPPGWRLRHLEEDWYVVEIRAPLAGQVAIMGDFTDWQPVLLHQPEAYHRPGQRSFVRWELSVRIAPGVHQVQVQIDQGPWQRPDGLAASADGFDGTTGVFVAE